MKDTLRKIRAALIDRPLGMTITEISTRIGLNRNSTARYLDVLLITGQVEMTEIGTAKVFSLTHRIPVEAALDLSQDGILMLNSRLQVVRVNETFSALVGLAAKEILGTNYKELKNNLLSILLVDSLIQDGLAGSVQTYECKLELGDSPAYYQVKLVPTIFDDGDSGITVIVEDISKRKVTDLKLEQQSAFLENVMESVAHPFYVIDANDYSILMANKAARLGALNSDSTCHLLTHNSNTPCTGDIHPCPLQEVKRTGEPVVVEHVHQTQSGDVQHLEIHAHPIFDRTGSIVQMIEYNLDITDRKRVEEAYQEEIRLMKAVLDSADKAHFVIQDSRIAFANSSFHEFTDYSRSEIRDHGIEMILNDVMISVVLGTTETRILERVEIRCKDSTTKVVTLHITPLSPRGINAILCTF